MARNTVDIWLDPQKGVTEIRQHNERPYVSIRDCVDIIVQAHTESWQEFYDAMDRFGVDVDGVRLGVVDTTTLHGGNRRAYGNFHATLLGVEYNVFTPTNVSHASVEALRSHIAGREMSEVEA